MPHLLLRLEVTLYVTTLLPLGVTIGIQQETYIASEENSLVTVCATISSGMSERSLAVTLSTAGGDAEGIWERGTGNDA